MTADLTFAEAIRFASLSSSQGRRHRRPVTGYYPSAGDDVGPLILLDQEHLRQRAIDLPTPEVLVYVDRERPEDPGHARLEDRHRRPDWPGQLRTVSVDPLNVGGLPAGLLTVAVRTRQRSRHVRVLRIRGENAHVLEMCQRARWSPTMYIAPDDGCCGYGGNEGRCENSVMPGDSPFTSFAKSPRWWITEHFWPHAAAGGNPDLSDLERWGFPFDVKRLGLVHERWGHDWEPFGGATAFELTPRGDVR